MNYFIANVSFGKDSLAMLLLILEKGLPLDEVVFYDTGAEFEAIYRMRDRVKSLLAEKGILFTELYPKNPFFWSMFERPVKKRNGDQKFGYGWCGRMCRWGTTEKTRTLNSYKKGAYVYIGLAADEIKRLERLNNQDSKKLFPLVDAGMTEVDCLEYCRAYGFDWVEDGVDLYDVLDRVSCWCCWNKNLKELRGYYQKLPKYWKQLKDLEERIGIPYRNGVLLVDLEKRWEEWR